MEERRGAAAVVGGVQPFVFERSEAAQKKEVKELFFLHAEGEESVHTLAAPDNSSTTCPRVPKSTHKMCVLTHA